MPKLKMKSAAAPAAQTREEAERLVHRLGEIQRELIRREADLGDTLARIKAAAEKGAQPLKVEAIAAHEAVQAWSEANRDTLTRSGKVKTVQLATGKVSWRNRPPSVRISKKKVDAVLAWLRNSPGGLGYGAFIRVKSSIDREAMQANPELARTVPDVSIGSEGEEFIVEPFDAELVEG